MSRLLLKIVAYSRVDISSFVRDFFLVFFVAIVVVEKPVFLGDPKIRTAWYFYG